MKNRFLYLVLSLVLIVGAFGCKKTETTTESETNVTGTSYTTDTGVPAPDTSMMSTDTSATMTGTMGTDTTGTTGTMTGTDTTGTMTGTSGTSTTSTSTTSTTTR